MILKKSISLNKQSKNFHLESLSEYPQKTCFNIFIKNCTNNENTQFRKFESDRYHITA